MSQGKSEHAGEMPGEIDFRRGTRGLHYIPAEKRVLLPISVDKEVWDLLAAQATASGVTLSEFVTAILQREIRASQHVR